MHFVHVTVLQLAGNTFRQQVVIMIEDDYGQMHWNAPVRRQDSGSYERLMAEKQRQK